MHKTAAVSGQRADRRIVKLGSARRLTQAAQLESYPEMAGDKTQRFGG